jgi:hypothetical protein
MGIDGMTLIKQDFTFEIVKNQGRFNEQKKANLCLAIARYVCIVL